ncbi:hypothetical protein [Streptomyces sp. enrichment culture]|uniref:hypothetical protein n=1 Tax=Streptomyces sp. enrichment culture TaxID=1795815 RepID=UPI003F55F88E
MTEPTTPPTVTPDPDGDGVVLHLPEITYLDTQVWAVDVGLTAEGLAALRAVLDRTPAVPVPSAVPSAETLREQLLHAIDFPYCQMLGYGTPEELLAAYDASRTSTTDPAALRDRIAAAVVRLHESGGLYALDAGEDGRIADAVLAVLPAVAAPAAPRERLRGMALSLATGSGPLVEPAAFDAALDDYRDAVAAAVLPAPADQAALRDQVAKALADEDARAWGYDHDFVDQYGADAETDGFVDAVLAVLPATTAVDVAALRDRVAGALYERERPGNDPHWPAAYAADREVFEAMADAVLPAVLPVAAPAAPRETAAAILAVVETALGDTLTPDARAEALAGIAAVLPATTRHDTEIRAAALREAADFVGNDDDCGCGGCDSCVPNKLAAELRRMADGTAATETQAEALSPAERTMLGYALDQAQERIWSEDGFTDEDQAAVDSLRRLTAGPAAGARQDGAS